MGKVAEVEATYYHGDGVPYGDAQRKAYELGGMDNLAYYNWVQSLGGFHTRRYRADANVTPPQHASDHLFDALTFGFGRANIVTRWGSTKDREISLPIEDLEIDEDTPGAIFDLHRRTNREGRPERYVLVEFVYREIDDDDHDEPADTSEPQPTPGDEIQQPVSLARRLSLVS